jgi:hypothetical protein
MLAKGTTIDFNGQNVYAGIDIHLKSWKVTIMLGDREHKTFSQDPNAETLRNYLRKNFPGAVYHSAYEAGGLRAISCQAEKQLGRKDAHRKPPLPHLTGS